MRAVVKIGGSLLYDAEGKVIVSRVRDYASVIESLVKSGHSLVVVVGGGRPARTFIAAARELGASEAQCDWLGIKLARNNAELLCAALGAIAYPKIVDNLDELEVAVNLGKVILMGGLIPGQSTNAVAAIAAELIQAEILLNATNIDGVYDRDPKEKGAVKLDTVTIEQLRQILKSGGTRAGEYELFDPVAIRIVERSKIPTTILDGSKPENLARAIRGEKIGTQIITSGSK
ncbi:MAG: UMP kinase [Candidatus Thorarchaeota archaeon]|nr:UMP kinase [Candidatus Thorarchaeota archaeon]